MSTLSLNSTDTESVKSEQAFVGPYYDLDTCPSCLNIYDFIRRPNTGNGTASRIPLILHCDHVVCEKCICVMRRNNKCKCPICNDPIEVTKRDLNKLPEIFSPHFTIMGRLVFAKSIPRDISVQMVTTGRTLKNIQGGCTGSVENVPDLLPDISKYNDEFSEIKASLSFEQCTEHPETFKNLQCQQCTELVCCQCFIEFHPGHMPINLYKLNVEDAQKFQQQEAKLRQILRNLYESQKKINRLNNFDPATIEKEIKKYFNNLHAKLLKIERSFLNTSSNVADNTDITEDIQNSINIVSQYLSLCNMVNSKQFRMKAILEKIEELESLPCKLITEIGDYSEPLKLIGPDFSRENFAIEFNAKGFQLEPCDNFNENSIDLNELQLTFQPGQSTSPKIMESIASSGKSSTLIPNVSQHEAPKINKNEDPRCVKKIWNKPIEKQLSKVIVTHINNMNSFYIQTISCLRFLKMFNNSMNQKPKRLATHNDIVIGFLYMVHYSLKKSKQWRRGKLISISNDSTADIYEILYIDYGNTQYVSIDKLRLMDVDLCRKPPFAQQCCLKYPGDSAWDENIHLHFAQIVNEKEIFMRITQKLSSVLQEIELFMYGSNGSLVQISEILNYYPMDESILSEKSDEMKMASSLRLFKNSQKFFIGETKDVIVTHVIDPLNIFVLLVKNIGNLREMQKKMKIYYEKNGSTCIPIEDTDCIIKYENERHGCWHRATIIGVNPRLKIVTAFLVDWGITLDIPWKDVRQLVEDFIKIEAQAIKIQLAHIDPITPWETEASQFLKSTVLEETKLKMVVHNTIPINVALFKDTLQSEICINALLVEKKFAVSTGHISETIEWVKDAEEEQIQNDNFSSHLIRTSQQAMCDEEDLSVKKGLKAQIIIIRCTGPNLIYFKFSSNKEMEETMIKELQIHYQQNKLTKLNWKVYDLCVVWDNVTSSFVRGVIQNKINNGTKYSVYLYDHSRDVKLEKSSLFVYDQYFQKNYPDTIYKCYLYNLKPAGDSGKWTHLAIEMLQEIFNTYKTLFVKKMEDDMPNKAFGFNMWYALTISGNALEPNKVKFVSINRELVEAGVAFYISKPEAMDDLTLNRTDSLNELQKNIISWADECEKEQEDVQISDRFSKAGTSEDYPKLLDNLPMVLELPAKEFKAKLVCLFSTGILSVRNEECQKFYTQLETSINDYLNKQESKICHQYESNQYCSIKYDDMWYRGKILEVISAKKYMVEMIDFSSDHKTNASNLSEVALYQEVPPLLFHIGLYNVKPVDGEWDFDDYQTVMSLLADEMRFVIKDQHGSVPLAEVYYLDGRSLNDLAVKKCHKLIRIKDSESTEDNIEKGTQDKLSLKELQVGYEEKDVNEDMFCAEENKQGIKYNTHPLLISGTSNVSIIKVLNEKEIILKIHDPTSYSFTDIVIDGHDTPKLTDIANGQPCICLNAKNEWCRGLVYNTDSFTYGYVLIFLVDKGSLEMISIQNIRIIDRDSLHLPILYYIANLDIRILNDSKIEIIKDNLNKLIGQNLDLSIVALEPLTVQLYYKGILCYQHLIDQRIIS